jgi:hypothetical protein
MRSNFRLSLILAALFSFSSFSATTIVVAFTSPRDVSISGAVAVDKELLRQQWVDRSVSYYSKVMREERRRNMGQIDHDEFSSEVYQQEFQRLAKKHYFALRKIKDGQYQHAEVIYKRIIHEIMNEEDDGECDHAKLAVTTLLLALHCQRMGDMKKTRSVFLNFFRVVVVDNHGEEEKCACSAKVLGAFALFEMKQGNAKKSLEIARKAVGFDPALEPVLNWKQFRDVQSRNSNLHP